MLEARGFDADVLRPLMARVDGKFELVKWLEDPQVCEDGSVRFKVTWRGRRAASRICCHDLNAAARYHVRMCD